MISQEEHEEDRQVSESLATATARPPPAPPSSPQAGPSGENKASFNAPSLLAALAKHLTHSATPRVRLDKDPFCVLESSDKETRRAKDMPMVSFVDQKLEDFEEAELNVNLRPQALASGEPVLPPHEDLPSSYEEILLIFYQVSCSPLILLS